MPEWLTNALNETWVQVTAAITLVATIAALLGNLDKISEWHERRVKKRKEREERRELPLKTYEMLQKMQVDYACISGTVKGQAEKLDKLTETVNELRQQNEEQYEKIEEMKDAIKAVDADTGNILCSQLTREHDYFMDKGYCPSADKARIASIHESYKGRGRNHLAEHFINDVLSLPEKKQ